MSNQSSNKKDRGQLENLVADLRSDFIQTEARQPAKKQKLAEPKVGKEIRMRKRMPKWVPLMISVITLTAVASLFFINRAQPAETTTGTDMTTNTAIEGEIVIDNADSSFPIPESTLLPEPPVEEPNEEIVAFEYELVEPDILPNPPDPTPEPEPDTAP
ncbi:MAG: hypothetical protein GY943_10245 [Chloroflexi bacterium]|nr:hypothetical protein [Chloroflexota bacterium]